MRKGRLRRNISRFIKYLDRKRVREQKLGLKKEASNENLLLKIRTDLKNKYNFTEREADIYLESLKNERRIIFFNLRILEECILFIHNNGGIEDFVNKINEENISLIASSIITDYKSEIDNHEEAQRKLMFEIFSYLIFFIQVYSPERTAEAEEGTGGTEEGTEEAEEAY
jgi:hypothetical protein